MKYARVLDNLVAEVFTPPVGVKITDCFHPDVEIQFQLVSDEVEANWVLQDDGTFLAPAVEEEVLPTDAP